MQKVKEFLPELRLLIHELEQDKRLAVHSRIDQFHYMTRAEELKILLDQYEREKSCLDATAQLILSRYDDIIKQYNKDKEWITGMN
ncbi:MAG: hypothetical protein HOP08_00790 [Cyclobacteriaceae bacterium]|nr:hypothetical protein [Cyclobacteriaceae bacterium]